MAKDFKVLPKCLNFAKSGHTATKFSPTAHHKHHGQAHYPLDRCIDTA